MVTKIGYKNRTLLGPLGNVSDIIDKNELKMHYVFIYNALIHKAIVLKDFIKKKKTINVFIFLHIHIFLILLRSFDQR
jgi:hypothetical protein